MSKKHQIILEVDDKTLNAYKKAMLNALEYRGKVKIHDVLGLLKYGFEQDLVDLDLLAETHCEDEDFPVELLEIEEENEE